MKNLAAVAVFELEPTAKKKNQLHRRDSPLMRL
jgi:hypothetical protein